MHSTMSPPASNADLPPATGKIAVSPPPACRHSQRYPMIHCWRSVSSVCHVGPVHERESLQRIPRLCLRSTFHKQPLELRVTKAGAHVQAFCVSPECPQGQGCAQSDIFFMYCERQEGDFEGVSRKGKYNTGYEFLPTGRHVPGRRSKYHRNPPCTPVSPTEAPALRRFHCCAEILYSTSCLSDPLPCRRAH